MTTIVTNASSSIHIAGDNVCLLKSAVANGYANKIEMSTKIPLDEGSQRSFLTEGLTGYNQKIFYPHLDHQLV